MSSRLISALVVSGAFVLSIGSAFSFGQCFGDRTDVPPSAARQYQSMGESLAMSGNVMVAGAPYGFPNKGSAFISRWDGTAWSPTVQIQAPDTTEYDLFGRHVATDGERVITLSGVTDQNLRGKAYIYRYENGSWVLDGTLLPPDEDATLSRGVGIYGNIAVIGDPDRSVGGQNAAGMAYIYLRGPGGWSYLSKLFVPLLPQNSRFGISIVVTDKEVVVSAPETSSEMVLVHGNIFVFPRTGDSVGSIPVMLNLPQQTTGDALGRTLAVDGNRIAAGGGGGGTHRPVHTFVKNAGVWSYEGEVDSPWGESFVDWGRSVDLSGDFIAVGAPDYTDSFFAEGAVLVYRRSGGTWVPVTTLFDPAPAPFDRFGYSLGLDGGRLTVGIPDESSEVQENGLVMAYKSSTALIVPNPQDATVEAGTPAMFSSVASGAGPLTYKWTVNNQMVPAGLPPYEGADTSMFTITHAFAPLTDAIRVTVVDSCGLSRTSLPADLTLTPPSGTCEGDANQDSVVNFADITAVLLHFNTACP